MKPYQISVLEFTKKKQHHSCDIGTMLKLKCCMNLLPWDRRRINGNRSVRSKTHREKKLLIQKFIKEKSQENEKKHVLLESKMDELAAIRQYHINVLQKYIFSVEEVTFILLLSSKRFLSER
jgi:hypothetical protein